MADGTSGAEGVFSNLETDQVYNRFKRSDNYKGVMIRAGNGSQSSEMNEIQSIERDEIRVLTESLYKEGQIMKGGKCHYSPGFEEVTDIFCNNYDSIVESSYFTLHHPTEGYYHIWFSKDGSGSAPSIGGTNIEIPLLPNPDHSTGTLVASIIQPLLDGAIFTVVAFEDKVKIKNSDVGLVDITIDGDIPTNFVLFQTVKSGPLQSNLEATVFYAEEYTHDIPSWPMNIVAGEPETMVGIAILKEVVSEIENIETGVDGDVDLLDQAKGTENYGTKGAVRVKMTGRWCREAEVDSLETFYGVHEFDSTNTLVTPEVRLPEINTTKDLVAEYDNDANGNFVTDGFIVSYQEPTLAGVDGAIVDSHLMSLSAGIAHITGYKVSYPYSQKFFIEQIDQTDNVNNELINFTGTGWYILAKSPFKWIGEINGVQRPSDVSGVPQGEAVLHTVNTTAHEIRTIHWIALNADGTGVISEDDYSYTSGTDVINWSSNPGVTYYVHYEWSVTIEQGTYPTTDGDFPDDVDHRNYDTNSIYLTDTTFYPNTPIDVDYSYYLNRVDRVTISKEGEIIVIKGDPSYQDPLPSVHTRGLNLCTVYVSKEGDPEVTMEYYRAFKMSDVQLMFNRLDDLQFNVARLGQLENIRSKDVLNTKKNTFTDPFFDNDTRNMSIAQDAITVEEMLIPGYNLTTDLLSISEGDSEFKLLDYTEETVVNQWRFTGDRQINAFMWQGPPPLSVTISPKVYSWVAETIATQVIRDLITGEEHGSTWHTGWRWPYNPHWLKTVGSTVTKRESTKLATKPYEVPELSINVKATKLNSQEFCTITFDKKEMGNSYRADSNGYLNKNFDIPAGTLSGEKEITVTGNEGLQTGRAVFLSIPFVKRVNTLITHNKVKVLEDPVAQVFKLKEDYFVTSVEIMVSQLPDSYIEVFLMPTVVGYPDRDNGLVVNRKYKADITVNNSNSDLNWTKFSFLNPTLLDNQLDYSTIVSCTDPNAKIRFARLGEYELTNNKWMTVQAQPEGVMLESSTGSTWAALHKDDLTYKINVADFSENGTATIVDGWISKTYTIGTIAVGNYASGLNCTDIFLTAATEVYPDTEIVFEASYTNSDGPQTRTIEPFNYFEIDNGEESHKTAFVGNVTFTVTLRTKENNNYISPIVNKDIYISHGHVILPSEYITKPIEIDVKDESASSSVFNIIKANLDVYEPTYRCVTFYYWNEDLLAVGNTDQSFSITHNSTGAAGVIESNSLTVPVIKDGVNYKVSGGEFFILNTLVGLTNYYVWFTIDNVGRDPKTHSENSAFLADYTGIEVNLKAINTATQNAYTIAATINGYGGIDADNASSDTVTLTASGPGAIDNVGDAGVNNGYDGLYSGEGYKRFTRVDSKELGEGFTDVGFSDILVPEQQTTTHFKIVLDTAYNDVNLADVSKRPSVGNLRAYLYEA